MSYVAKSSGICEKAKFKYSGMRAGNFHPPDPAFPIRRGGGEITNVQRRTSTAPLFSTQHTAERGTTDTGHHEPRHVR